jgi:hypothetical protein
MAVPKATIYFDHFATCGKYDVGLSGQVSHMEAISISGLV